MNTQLSRLLCLKVAIVGIALFGIKIDIVSAELIRIKQGLAEFSGELKSVSLNTNRDVLVAQGSNPFSDVPPDHWASQYIQGLAERGIVTGDPDGKFRPDAPMTRVEFAALLSKAFPQAEIREPTSFPDVSREYLGFGDYWGIEAVKQANASGFLNGYEDGKFRPNQKVQKGEALVSLVNGLGYQPNNLADRVVSYYQDSDEIPGWAIEQIAAATEQQIVVNHPNTRKLNLSKLANRAEIAALIYQALARSNSTPQVASNYIPITMSNSAPVTGNDEACKTEDIQGYINKLSEVKKAELNFHPSAYQALVKCGEKSVISLVRELSQAGGNGENNAAYRAIILTAFKQIGNEAIPELIAIIKSPQERYSDISEPKDIEAVKLGAVNAIGAVGDNASGATQILVDLIRQEQNDVNGQIESSAIYALGRSGAESADELIQLLRDYEKDEAILSEGSDTNILAILSQMDSAASSIVPALIEIFENPNIEISQRVKVAKALGSFKAEPSIVIPFLVEQVDNEFSSRTPKLEFIESSITAIGNYEEAAADVAPNLTNILNTYTEERLANHRWRNLYWETIESLGKIGFSDSETISTLKEIVGAAPTLDSLAYIHPEFHRQSITCAAADALSQQKPEVKSEIKDLLTHDDIYVRTLASHILVDSREESLRVLWDNLNQLNTQNKRTKVLYACYSFSGIQSIDEKTTELAFSSDALPALVSALNGNNEFLRIFAIYGVGGLTSDAKVRTIPSLIQALKVDDTYTQEASVKVLDSMGIMSQDASEALFGALSDTTKTNAMVRAKAAYALLSVNIGNYPAKLTNDPGTGEGGRENTRAIRDQFIRRQ